MKPNISIIMPAHNEEKRIGRTLEEYTEFFMNLKNKKEIEDFELLVVLNACEDGTFDIVKKVSQKCRQLSCISLEQKGKGFAVVEGFKEMLKRKRELIGFVDADMATSPEAFYDLIKNMEDYDGIIASRRVPGAVVSPKKSIQRAAASSIFNFLVRGLFLMPYRDTQCGAKIFKKEAIAKVLPKIGITKWAFDVDLLYKLRKENNKIKEFPTFWSDKKYSTLNLKSAGPSMVLAILRLRLLNSPFRDFVKLYNKINEKFLPQNKK